MEENMGKTIKQLAEEIGVSKQAIHQKRKSKELSTALQPFTSTVDGVVYISVDGEKLIKQAFLKDDRKQVDGLFTSTVYSSFTPLVDGVDSNLYAVLKQTIDTLQTQLERKDQQLAEKDKQIQQLLNRLSETQNALISEQKTVQSAQALHAGTIQQICENNSHNKNENLPKKKKWWKWK